MRDLREQPYQGYAYAYPHKTAYRAFEQPLSLQELWAREDQKALYLYVHVPFCEMRCGFCNLFTTTNPKGDLVSQYLEALESQMKATAAYLGDGFRFARGAVGGGTPTFLSVPELSRFFDILQKHLGGLTPGMPVSFETSPATVDPEKLELLKEQGITRVSIGVQSFFREETKSLGRPQDPEVLEHALTLMRKANFPVLNIDLIYGCLLYTSPSPRD